MITPEKIDEWIREAEDRTSSASLIIRFIGNRLMDLTKWNEELQSENLALRTEKKVEEYEKRIETLEYQLGLLKRQIGGNVELPDTSAPVGASGDLVTRRFDLIIYNHQGQVLRLELSPAELSANTQINTFSGEELPADTPLQLLVVPQNEELLFAFDSGRTITMPVTAIPLTNDPPLDWQQAYLQTPLGTEELAFIKPVGRMALFDFCVQISRKGCVKKIKESVFETYLGKSYIGTGIKAPPDKTCDLALCNRGNRIILLSKEGFLQCIDVDPLPTTIEDVIRLGVTDHIIISSIIGEDLPSETSLLFITQNGKAIQRQLEWMDIASSYKTRGQAIFSQERRAAGIRLIAASLVKADDYGIALHSDGALISYRISDLIGSGTLLSGDSQKSILGFTAFSTR